MRELIAAAKEDGYSLAIVSGYRTMDRSRVLYANKIAEYQAMGHRPRPPRARSSRSSRMKITRRTRYLAAVFFRLLGMVASPHVLEAAGQSGRGMVPEVRPLLPYPAALDEMAKSGCPVLFYERATRPLGEVLAPRPPVLSLLVGAAPASPAMAEMIPAPSVPLPSQSSTGSPSRHRRLRPQPLRLPPRRKELFQKAGAAAKDRPGGGGTVGPGDGPGGPAPSPLPRRPG